MSDSTSEKDLIVYADVRIHKINLSSSLDPNEREFPCHSIGDCEHGAYLLFELIEKVFTLSRVKTILFIHFAVPHQFYAFNLKCREICRQNEITYHFVGSHSKIILYGALARTETMVNSGETVLVIEADSMNYHCKVVIREENGYRLIETYPLEFTFDLPILRQRILKNYVPKKIILYALYMDSQRSHELDARVLCVNRVCPGMKIMHEPEINPMDILDGLTRDALGERKSPYSLTSFVDYEFGLRHRNKWIIEVKENEAVPLEKSVVIKNDGKNITVSLNFQGRLQGRFS